MRKLSPYLLGAVIGLLITAPIWLHGQQATQHGDFITWTASGTPGVTYNVYQAPETGTTCGTFTLITSGVTGTSYLAPAPTQAQPGASYCYEVDAVASSGTLSGPSNVATITNPTTFPPNPNPPTGVAVNSQ